MDPLLDWQERMSVLDAALRPIANRSIDITDPNWVGKLQSIPNPLEEAGIRMDTEELLAEMIAAYPLRDEEGRAAIRSLVAEHKSFQWAARLSHRPITNESFRAHLILFSMKDQGRDTRDAILDLGSFCSTATSAGVVIAPVLKEIAGLSSRVNKYGMGSTYSLLLHEYERASKR